jgi:hypothetical protein
MVQQQIFEMLTDQIQDILKSLCPLVDTNENMFYSLEYIFSNTWIATFHTLLALTFIQWYSAGLQAGSSGVRVPAGAGNFSLHHRVQTGSGANLASYPMGTRGSSLGVKRPRGEANHSSPCSAEVMNTWSCNSTLQYAFMAWCSLKAQENFTFTLPSS